MTIRCAHCEGRHTTAAEVRDCAAYAAYVNAEVAHEARYPHVDFPDGADFARIEWDERYDADVRARRAEVAYRAALVSHPDAF